jgi:tetratricopeptide (TPR) repeat protein
MSSLLSEEYLVEVPAPGSFLRNVPGPSVQAPGATDPKQEGPPAGSAAPIFPPPAVEESFTARLAAWERFSTLAVRVDPPASAMAHTPLHTALAACLDNLSAQSTALWFPWARDLYGCAVASTDPRAAYILARRMQSELSAGRIETISIGISEYPLFDFDIAESLQNACKALNHAAFLGPDSIVILDSVSLNISGDGYYQSGDYDAAISEYRAALCLDAANVNVLNSLGVCLAQQGKLAEARQAFEDACRIDAGEAMAIYNIGILHLLEKDNARALGLFRKAFAADPNIFEIPFNIGKLLMENKAYPEALVFLDKALALCDTLAPAHSLKGRCLACLGCREEAVAAYRKAIKINPNDAAALSALGTIFDTQGENPEISLTFCRQSVAVSPENILYRLRLARLYHKHNHLEKALAEYETASVLGYDARRQIAEIQGLIQG